MRTKNVPEDLKCKINNKGFPKGGGSNVWEKFPNNLVFFLRAYPSASKKFLSLKDKKNTFWCFWRYYFKSSISFFCVIQNFLPQMCKTITDARDLQTLENGLKNDQFCLLLKLKKKLLKFSLSTLSCGKSPGQGCSTMLSTGAGGQQRNPSHTAGQHGQHPGGMQSRKKSGNLGTWFQFFFLGPN